jgi:hypothetical protein
MAESDDLTLCPHAEHRHACPVPCTCGHACAFHRDRIGCTESGCRCRQFTGKPDPPERYHWRAHD